MGRLAAFQWGDKAPPPPRMADALVHSAVTLDAVVDSRPHKRPRASQFHASFVEGNNAEARFCNALRKDGWVIKMASFAEDTRKHIDVHAIKEGTPPFSTDVKGAKRFFRGGEVQYDWVWIELHGVNRGNDGWLLGGHADCIAFETLEGFELFDRKRLVDAVLPLIDRAVRVTTPAAARYCVYQRAGRLDEISLVELAKLKATPAWLRTLPAA